MQSVPTDPTGWNRPVGKLIRSGPAARPAAKGNGQPLVDLEQLRRRPRATAQPVPEGELRQLSRSIEVSEARIREQVHQPDGVITDVYFPITSVFSMVGIAGERVVEVATVGAKG